MSATSAYNEALEQLVASAQQFGRLNPSHGLTLYADGQTTTVPIVHQGFAWRPADFECLRPAPHGHDKLLMRRYECPGAGVPLVVERSRQDADSVEARFYPEKSYFAATAVLRFSLGEGTPGGAENPYAAALEFYNPLARRSLEIAGASLPLATDLSAPLTVTLQQAPRSYFAGFVEPGRANTTARLHFLEPYQPGKAPVVLIHGLYSDPQSWADLINDLRAAPGFTQQNQIWVFRYPTGQGFLQSAAALRRELRAAVDTLDPAASDPALRQMTLIGHSMGGLVAKLQVTHSDELVWSRLANRPLEEIVTTPSTRAFLAQTCYFVPSPNVARVVFIASPHCGSLCSSALIGKGAALLVEPSPEQTALHEQLIRDNPDTFNPLVERRFPTSVDMLSPNSPLLDAMRHMRLADNVALHNLVGVSHPISLDGPSDGVVSVRSAEHPDCESVLAISASHAKVHRTLEASLEIMRILTCPLPKPAPPTAEQLPYFPAAVDPAAALPGQSQGSRAK